MSVPKRIVALIDAKNEEILRLEREKAESEHALGFAIDRVERLKAEKAEMLEALENLYNRHGELSVCDYEKINAIIEKERASDGFSAESRI